MSNKLIYLMCFVVVLGCVSSASADLVAYWPLDNDANDAIGELNWTLDPNGTSFSTDSMAGTGALRFDGITGEGRQDAVGPLIDAFTTKTVVFWVKADSTSGIQALYDEGGATNGLAVRINEGTLQSAVRDNSVQYTLTTPFDSTEWTEVAVSYDFGLLTLWVDGAEKATVMAIFDADEVSSHSNNPTIGATEQDAFGNNTTEPIDHFAGLMDDIRLYDHALPVRIATLPTPADGAVVSSTRVDLSWAPGIHAVSHDVYLGNNLDDVAAGTADTFMGNQLAAAYTAVDLAPETTYYWRVDEVNDLDPNSPWPGQVWSFTIAPLIAFDPSPADGAKFVGPAVTLSWTAGVDATSHTVYIGDDFGVVSSATGGVPQTGTTYDAGVLAKGTMYHWRVDEFDGTTTHKGDVWSFETPTNIPITDPNLIGWWKMDNEGFGVAVVDSSGYDHHGTIHGNPQWIDGYGGGAMDFDGSVDYLSLDGYKGVLGPNPFSITTWINTSDIEGTIMGWGSTAGGTTRVEFRIDAHRLRCESSGNVQGDTTLPDNEWIHVAVTVKAGAIIDDPDVTLYLNGQVDNRTSTGGTAPLDMAPGYDVTIARRHTSGRFLDALIDDLRLYDKELSADEIKQAMRTDLAQAWDPQPDNFGTASIWTPLSWRAGDGAAEHDVYLGTDAAAVAAADASDTTGIYLGRQAETMITAELAWITKYYWRVDEVAADGTISTGHVWSFTTTDEIVLYDEVTPFPYDNSADPFLSEVALDLDPAQDWTGGCGGGIGAIAISYDGQAAPGSVTQADGTYTINGRGDDIWGTADQFQFAHKTLAGDGSMIVKVESLASTDPWTKAGIMIRESLNPGSAFAAVFATGANGVRFQARTMTDQSATADDAVATAEQKALTPPVWLKIERIFPMISAYYSTDGVAWTPMAWNPQVIPMSPLPIHIGLAVTSHSGADTYAEAVFSNVSSTGGVAAGPLNSAEVGLESNAAEPMYLVLEDAGGVLAAALNPDSAATQLVGAEWIVDLDEFNIDRAAVAKATLVIGDVSNPAPGGSGLITINRVRLLPDGYTFDGDAAAYGPDGPDSLDGTWNHSNGSDEWDGTWIGEGRPGGVSVLLEGNTTFLRLQDTGDPRDYGMGDPGSNRKIYLGHSITNDFGANADRILDGVTVMFRARVATGAPLDDVHPAGGTGIAPWPAEGDGYVIHDGGKGNISIRQSDGDMVISFALALASDDDELPASGLVMNKLNGPSVTGDVDIQGDEPGTLNILSLDPTQWHEYRIDISPDATGTGTHLVQVYLDGSTTSNDFIVTAGDGNDFDDSYIAIGVGATPQSGAIDIDYISYLCR